MKFPRTEFQLAQHRRLVDEFAGDEVYDIALPLDVSSHAEQAREHELLALCFGHARPDHDIDRAGFILQRDEGRAAGGGGALTAGDHAGGAQYLSVAGFRHFFGGADAQFIECRS